MTITPHNQTPEPAPAAEEPEGLECTCQVAPARGQLVLIRIEYGTVTANIICATCRNPLPYLVDTELIEATDIPLTLTYHDTTVHYPEPEYDGVYRLTAPTVEP